MSALTDHPEDLWYQEDEYRQMHKRIQQLILYVNSCESENKQQDAPQRKKKFCTRGLEGMIDGESAIARKHDAWECVLTAQQLRRGQSSRFDEQRIALAYATVTKESAAIARVNASNDAKAIAKYVERLVVSHEVSHISNGRKRSAT